MADDRSRKLTGGVPMMGSGPASSAHHTARDPRAPVVIPVRYRYPSFTDFVETQSMNVSRSGMFISVHQSIPVGTLIDFEIALADGFPLLRGTAEVVRLSARPAGLGIRFEQLDEPSRKLIDRIVEVNSEEGKRPTVALDFTEGPRRPLGSPAPSPIPSPMPSPALSSGGTGSGPAPAPRIATKVIPGIEFMGRELRVEINPATAVHFTNNPLLNIRLGGFVIPGPEDVPLGTIYSVTIYDIQRAVLWSGNGKVVAKHESRIGIRLNEVPRDVLARLQAEVARTAPPSK